MCGFFFYIIITATDGQIDLFLNIH